MRRARGQLVCEHLENIQGTVLEKYPHVINEFVRGRHGVYALYRRNQLYYVGLASNLRRRLSRHLKDKHKQKWDRFSIYITTDAQHMKDLESLLLRIASPKGNQVRGRFVKSENLVKQLSQKIRKQQDRERDDIVHAETPHKTDEPSRKTKRPPAKKATALPLARLLKRNQRIRCDYKGKRYVAKVRTSGIIMLDGKEFESPSIAARHVTGRHTNGWRFWRFQKENGDWLPLNQLKPGAAGRSQAAKQTSRTRRARTTVEFDTIICPARDDGFRDTFLGENCWYAIRLSAKKIPFIKYCAVYRRRPTSAITHYARVKSIQPYKNTGKYIVRFVAKARKLPPVKLNSKTNRKRLAPQGPCFSTLAKIKAAKTLDDI